MAKIERHVMYVGSMGIGPETVDREKTNRKSMTDRKRRMHDY